MRRESGWEQFWNVIGAIFGITFIIILLVLALGAPFIINFRYIGASCTYGPTGEQVVPISTIRGGYSSWTVLFLVRRNDGTTMTVPMSDLTPDN